VTSSALANSRAPLARVALARDIPRMLAAPALIALASAALIGLGMLVLGGVGTIALVALGAGGVAVAAWLAARILSLRLAVEVDYLHLTGIGTDRRYHLAQGPLSRLVTAGPSKANLGTGLRGLIRGVGSAPLSESERINVIRLGATPTVILVPTEQGRLAVAVAAEQEFLASLMAAAQTRAARPAAPIPQAPPEALSARAVPLPVPADRPLTGIERMELEERLAIERRAALTGARSEQAAAGFSATAAILAPTGTLTAPVVPAPAALPLPRAVAPAPATTAEAPPATPWRRPIRPMAHRVRRPVARAGLLLIIGPLLGVLAIWGLSVVLGTPPAEAGFDPLLAALLLCGPIAAVAIWQAWGKWPRLAGLTSVATLIVVLLVTWAVIG
jgi:hypothetical protein